MEVGLESDLPTYAGGLGILAGDTLRAAADLGLSMVGVTLAHLQGYFRQSLDAVGNQTDVAHTWEPEKRLDEAPVRVSVALRGRAIRIRAWSYPVRGLSGRPVSVYLLDTELPENDPADRRPTDHLYGSDLDDRLCQEAVLGLGGLALLRALGHTVDATLYHMNIGRVAEHAAEAAGGERDERDEGGRQRCAEPERVGRVVARRLGRGRYRLGGRRRRRPAQRLGGRGG
jgi:starch phosphorylase